MGASVPIIVHSPHSGPPTSPSTSTPAFAPCIVAKCGLFRQRKRRRMAIQRLKWPVPENRVPLFAELWPLGPEKHPIGGGNGLRWDQPRFGIHRTPHSVSHPVDRSHFPFPDRDPVFHVQSRSRLRSKTVPEKSMIDFQNKIDRRFPDQNRFPNFMLKSIRDWKPVSGSLFQMERKTGDRFICKYRSAIFILKSGSGFGFAAAIRIAIKIFSGNFRDRFFFQKRSLILFFKPGSGFQFIITGKVPIKSDSDQSVTSFQIH